MIKKGIRKIGEWFLWVFQPEKLEELPSIKEKTKARQEKFWRWLVSPESLKSSEAFPPQKKETGLIKWLLKREPLDTLKVSSTAVREKGLLRWLFESETLGQAKPGSPFIPHEENFFRWLFKKESLL